MNRASENPAGIWRCPKLGTYPQASPILVDGIFHSQPAIFGGSPHGNPLIIAVLRKRQGPAFGQVFLAVFGPEALMPSIAMALSIGEPDQ